MSDAQAQEGTTDDLGIEVNEVGVPVLQLTDGQAPAGLVFSSPDVSPGDTSEIAKLRNDIVFLQSIEPLAVELEAARAVKAEDPARFFKAKQEFEAARTFIRQISDYAKATQVNIDAAQSTAQTSQPAPSVPSFDAPQITEES